MGAEVIIGLAILQATVLATAGAAVTKTGPFQKAKDLGLSIPFLGEEDDDDAAPAPLVDEDAATGLALRRRSIEARRQGRRSLRIDAPIRSPGLASGLGSGLRIPGF